ncbi:hypothetical protein [Stenotrophomonas chelatiphaga]|uniref:hypothetical protein n=1 Tax=Stenotrophomonas chelatiphaga TaxID=517011 RepID=UPI00128F12E6|nr:hypothetical protein [Stenotrophomonas chelatiphaga]
MIRVISVNSERVQLLPDAVAENPELNIFCADSMTLIVGPNGSGKLVFYGAQLNRYSRKIHFPFKPILIFRKPKLFT